MRSLGWDLIQYDWGPYKKGKFGHRDRHEQREGDVKTQGEDGHLQTKERGLEQILFSQPSGGTNPANTLVSDLQHPDCEAIHLCCSGPPVCSTL